MTEPAQMVAGGGPLAPSRQVFENPHLGAPTRVNITADGRVFGHVANWGVCHTGIGNACVTAPKSQTNYARFHQGTVLTAEGDLVPVGKITLGGGHADLNLGMVATVEHYDNTTAAVAVVRAGEDDHGVWFAGSLVPGVSDERIAELRRSPLSGDWRRDQQSGSLELVAALAVNSPGFPISQVASGETIALCAAGMVVDMATDSTAITGPIEGHHADQVIIDEVIPTEAEPVVAAAEPVDIQATVIATMASQEELRGRQRRYDAILAADQMRRGDQLAALVGE